MWSRHRRVALVAGLLALSVPALAAQDSASVAASARALVFRRAQRLVNDGNGAEGRALVDSLLNATEPRSSEEAEVLFTLLAERYERRSVMVTSNLVFSQWDRIFRDQMATAAAIDRLVHHAVLLEFDVPSFRTDRSRPPAPTPPRANRRGRSPGPLVPKRRR